MKGSIKVGLALIVASLVLNVAVSASGLTEYISAVINKGIAVKVDGTKVSLTDESGTVYDPIIYKGRTYIPARFVANALGAKVNWNGDTNTVEITRGDSLSGIPYNDVDTKPTVKPIATPTLTPIKPTYKTALECYRTSDIGKSIIKEKGGYYELKGDDVRSVINSNFNTCTDLQILKDLGLEVYEYRFNNGTARSHSVDIRLDYGISNKLFKSDLERSKFWKLFANDMVIDSVNGGWVIVNSYAVDTDNIAGGYTAVKLKKGDIDLTIQTINSGINLRAVASK